ncbi:MAG: DUF4367 domain-containing protein [Lachnospiraceae bacterium]
MYNEEKRKEINMLLKLASDYAVMKQEFPETQPEEKEQEHVFSEEFLKQMHGIFRQEEKQQKRKKRTWRFHMAQAAAVLLLLVVAYAALPDHTVNAWKVKMHNMLIQEQDQCVTVVPSVEKAPDELTKKYPGAVFPAYVPDGYELIRVFTNQGEDSYHIIYVHKRDEDRKIIINEMPEGTTYVDNEHGKSREIEYNGIVYFVMASDEQIVLVWTRANRQYSLFVKESLKGALKIADSMIN